MSVILENMRRGFFRRLLCGGFVCALGIFAWPEIGRAWPELPSAAPLATAARFDEILHEARDLHYAALQHRRRSDPERVILLQRAVTKLMRALTLDEHHAETRLLLGSWLAYIELGDAALKQAIVELLRARQDDVHGALDCEIGGMLGIVYSHLGRFEDAVAEYDHAMRLLPGEPDLANAPLRQQQAMMLGNSAEALMALGRLDEAVRRYGLAESIDHSDQVALHALGLAVAYDRDGQIQKSKEALARSLAADPGLRGFQGDDVFFVPEGDRHYYWGLLYEEFGNRDEAIRSFREFLNEVPRSRYSARARSHIDALRQKPNLSLAELMRARVTIGQAQFPPEQQSGGVLHRHRDESEVQRVVNDHSFELRQCYARTLQKTQNVRGDLLLAMVIDRYGAVLLVQTLENTLSDQTPRDEGSGGGPGATELLRCVQSTVHRWRFAAGEADVIDQDELALPMRFAPQ